MTKLASHLFLQNLICFWIGEYPCPKRRLWDFVRQLCILIYIFVPCVTTNFLYGNDEKWKLINGWHAARGLVMNHNIYHHRDVFLREIPAIVLSWQICIFNVLHSRWLHINDVKLSVSFDFIILDYIVQVRKYVNYSTIYNIEQVPIPTFGNR